MKELQVLREAPWTHKVLHLMNSHRDVPIRYSFKHCGRFHTIITNENDTLGKKNQNSSSTLKNQGLCSSSKATDDTISIAEEVNSTVK